MVLPDNPAPIHGRDSVYLILWIRSCNTSRNRFAHTSCWRIRRRANDEALLINLDLFEEKKARSQFKLAEYQNRMARYYNSTVKIWAFKLGDLVLKKVLQHVGTLESNWEGSYRVVKMVRPGTYLLSILNGKKLSHPWNAKHLRTYYQWGSILLM